jgi:hypothetical protein
MEGLGRKLRAIALQSVKIPRMDIQSLCELGQEQLMAMEYLQAIRTLEQAEEQALAQNDFDALSRLYMPLQEARRQKRQRCGEGTIRLDLIAKSAREEISPKKIAAQFPHGQLLAAGWATLEPAIQLRKLQIEQDQYAEALLAAVYPIEDSRVIVIVPTEDVALPAPKKISIDSLLKLLPPHSLTFAENQLPNPDYSEVMNLWEQLHRPFLAAADQERDPRRKIQAYRKTIQVDYACELAHQNLAETARQLAARTS